MSSPDTDAKLHASAVTVRPDHDGYTFTFCHPAVTVTVARLVERAGRLEGELTVYAPHNGRDRRVTQVQETLSGSAGRDRITKRLKKLYAEVDVDWYAIIETVCTRTIDLYRDGRPAESLEPQEQDQPAYFICNPLIYDRHPTLLYGPGESGKSFVALYVACLLASGGTSSNLAVAPDGHNVLYLDWEMRAPEMRARVRQLRAAHPELTKAPLHRSMHLPLASCTPEIRREIHEKEIGIVIVDSLGPATGGEIERSSDPVAFFNALGSLGCASLLIGHVAKPSDEEKSRTPYGSVYYFNLARSIWEVRLVSEPESDQRTIALYHRKNNLGRRLPPLGYTLTITDAQARFEPCDPTEEPELARGLSLRERIRRILVDHEARTVQVIADATSADPDSVRRTLNRYKHRDWVSLQSDGKREGTWAIV
jgi:hypothetical protein